MNNNAFYMVMQASPLVKAVLSLLMLFSVFSWAIIFFKFKYLSRAEKETENFGRLLGGKADHGELLLRAKTLTLSPAANLFRAGLKNGSSEDSLKRALKRQEAIEVQKLEKYLNFLATTGSTTPFIGLFGTVWGIMNAFRHIGLQGSASLAVVAPGIAEALITTAMGLIAAIPAVMAYNYFLGRTRKLIADTESYTEEIEAILKEKPR